MNPNIYNAGCQNVPAPPMYPVAQQKGISVVAVIPGEESVLTYPVAAGCTALLVDFNTMRFWLKATDIYGRPLPAEPYRFEPIVSANTQPVSAQNQNDYVKKEDFATVAQMVYELYNELKGGDINVQSK